MLNIEKRESRRGRRERKRHQEPVCGEKLRKASRGGGRGENYEERMEKRKGVQVEGAAWMKA